MIDHEITKKLAALAGSRVDPATVRLSTPPRAPNIDAGAGVAFLTKSSQGNGGIASPLTEPDAATRTYHPKQTVVGTDGITQIDFYPIHSVDMIDANGSSVQLIFAIPDLNNIPT